MGKWLKVDASAGDAYVTKTLNYTPGLLGAISVEFDLVIPGSVLSGVVAVDGSAQFMRLTEGPTGRSIGPYVPDGTFWEVHDGGGATKDNDVAPAADTSMHVFLSAQNTTSGSFWTQQWFVDAVEFLDTLSGRFSGVDVGTLEFTTIDFGALLAVHDVGEVYYIKNVVVKDTSGTIIFQDDFEGGDLSAWDSVTGDATVVDFTPGGGGGGSTPGGDDCASAADLGAGASGTITDDNIDWAGTWPTGADPLWNYYEGLEGGGAPRWWKWTNAGADPVNFQIRHTGGLAINAAVMVGACGSLAVINDFGVNTNFGQAISDWSVDTNVRDVNVGPGETVYVEVDAYYDNPSPSEPPTGRRAFFTIEWTTVSVTYYDGIGVPASDLLTDAVGAGRDEGGMTVVDGLRVGDAYYFLWQQFTAGNEELWGGVINSDGTGFASAKITDYTNRVATAESGLIDPAGRQNIYTENDSGPVLCFDGSDVYACWWTSDGGDGLNQWDLAWVKQLYCPGSPFAETANTRTPGRGAVYRGHIVKWSGSAWDFWQLMAQDYKPSNTMVAAANAEATAEGLDPATAVGRQGPECSAPDYADVDFFTGRFHASADDPGYVWAYASYAGVRKYVSSFSNDWPMCDFVTTHPTPATISTLHHCDCPDAAVTQTSVFEVVGHWRMNDQQPTKSSVVLTSDGTNVSVGDIVYLPDDYSFDTAAWEVVQYKFVNTFSFPPVVGINEVKIGATAADSLANLKDAINGTGGRGVDYSSQTYRNQSIQVTASTSTTLTIESQLPGLASNDYTSSTTAAHLSFGGANFAGALDSGVPCEIRIRFQEIGIEHLTGYDPHVNPLFGSPDSHANDDGGWLDGAQPASSVAVQSFGLFTNTLGDGKPFLCVQPRDTFQDFTTIYKDQIEFWDYKGTVGQTNATPDFAPGSAPRSPMPRVNIFVSDVFANPASSDDERFVSLGSPGTARIISTVDADPIPIDSGNVPASDQSGFGRAWFCDEPRNYWGFPQPFSRAITQYDKLCYVSWIGAWTEDVEDLAPLGREFGDQRGFWQADEPPWVILLNDQGEIRKYTVARDYFICELGGAVPGLYAWQVF